MDNTFFIAGAQRSGTTLVATMLGRHPQVYISKHATTFRLVSCFRNHREVLPSAPEDSWAKLLTKMIQQDYKGRVKDFMDGIDLKDFNDARSAISEAIENQLKKNNCAIFGDKLPHIEHYLEDLMMLIPNARFLHIIRDGRSAALSKSNRGHQNLYLSAQHWVDSTILGIHHQAVIGPEKYKFIKFEDLILRTEETLKDICNFLSVNFDPTMMDLDEEIIEGQPYVQSEMDSQKITSYLDQLTDKQIRKIETIQGPLLRRFGYDLFEKKGSGYKLLSPFERMRYRQLDSFQALFRSKTTGMRGRKLIKVNIPLKIRLRRWVLLFIHDFFPRSIFEKIDKKRRLKDYKENNI